MKEAKAFRKEFTNLRVMTQRMSQKFVEKTGFNPDGDNKDLQLNEDKIGRAHV